MRSIVIAALLAATGTATAGEIDLGLGLQGTTTQWDSDRGGGGTLDIRYWFLPWVSATFLAKEQYAQVDDRFMSYFSVNGAFRQPLGPLRLTGILGLVHQHEEPRAAVMEMPLSSLFGVGDGIRHRMGGRAGAQLALPVWNYGRGDLFVALDLDITKFMDTDRGPSWMTSAGVSFGASFDFHAGGAK
ncbi:MAG: hypothetical protein ABI175_24605 [Polyangiales bacterium]